MMKKVFMRFPDFKGKALTLSYDDGVEQDIRFMNTIDEYGIKCTFNLNSDKLYDTPQKFEKGHIHRIMTKKAAIELYKDSGHEVAVHTSNHPFPNNLTPVTATAQIFEDRKALEQMFDTEIRGMAYPYGQFNDMVVEIAKSCGICYSRTTISNNRFDIPMDWLRLEATCHHNSPRLMELTEKFTNAKIECRQNPLLFYLWGHTYEFEQNDNWNVIEDFCKAIGNRDDIWYATNIEIYDYVEAFRSLRYTADGNCIFNPTCIPLYFEVYETKEKHIIAPGERIKI